MAAINADRFSKITGSFSDRDVAYTSVGLSINKILFPVDRPGGSKSCGWRLFFSFLVVFFPQKKELTIFLWEKTKSGEKKEIAAARLASILATRCTGNRIFFMDSLVSAH